MREEGKGGGERARSERREERRSGEGEVERRERRRERGGGEGRVEEGSRASETISSAVIVADMVVVGRSRRSGSVEGQGCGLRGDREGWSFAREIEKSSLSFWRHFIYNLPKRQITLQ